MIRSSCEIERSLRDAVPFVRVVRGLKPTAIGGASLRDWFARLTAYSSFCLLPSSLRFAVTGWLVGWLGNLSLAPTTYFVAERQITFSRGFQPTDNQDK